MREGPPYSGGSEISGDPHAGVNSEPPGHSHGTRGPCHTAAPASLQGYLAHKKPPPPRTLQ